MRPRFVSDEKVGEPLATSSADDGIVGAEHNHTVNLATSMLGARLHAMTAQDRLLLKFRFYDNLSVAEIARLIKIDQKALYRRLEALLRTLRAQFEAAGLHAADVLPALGSTETEPPALLSLAARSIE